MSVSQTPPANESRDNGLLFAVGCSSVVIFLLAIAYYFALPPPHIPPSAVLVIILMLLGVMVPSFVYAQRAVDWLDDNKPRTVPPTHQRGALIFVTILLILALAYMCHYSGGPRSPFSHFLVGVASMSIVLAKKRASRFALLITVVCAYVMLVFVPRSPVPSLEEGRHAFFDVACLILILTLATLHQHLADGREERRLQATRSIIPAVPK